MSDPLRDVGTVAALGAWIESAAWEERLSEIGTDMGGYLALRAAVDAASVRLSPERNDTALVELKRQLQDAPSDAPEAIAPLLAKIAARRALLPIEAHASLFERIRTDLDRRFPWACGGVGRSDRARLAGDLFCDYTGKSYISGAEPDRHGNLIGDAYDLAPDGAYKGQVVHVLQLYFGESFDFKLPTAALERKGFEVRRKTEPGSAKELREWLASATQLWVISHSKRLLEAEHIEVIRDLWRRGGALYIWGDNDPYYADANALLTALIDKDLEMAGNAIGGKVVDAFASGRGFHPHPITTGLAHLFEGITVASLPEAASAARGFTEILRGSAGNLITAVREASGGAGNLMTDGAFTRLYCNWDDAGSARYVSNAACFLAGYGARLRGEFTAEGALVGLCDMSASEGKPWLVMTVGELPDPLLNTDDVTLDDPLSAGARSCIVNDAAYAEVMGRWILGQPQERRLDPSSHTPVAGCLPLVDLADPKNRRGFLEILCACLMGGKDLPDTAGLLWLAVIDRMLLRTDLRRPEIWRWLRRQALSNLVAAPDLGDLGPKVPILEAFAALASPGTEEEVQLRLSLESVGVVIRSLASEKRASPDRLQRLARRALVVDAHRTAGSPEGRALRWEAFEREVGLGSLLSPALAGELGGVAPLPPGSFWESLAQARQASPTLAAAWG